MVMVFRLRFLSAACLGLACAALQPPAFSQAAPAPPAAQQSLLPDSFAGWTAIAPPKTGTAPESTDPANADVLKEYGLKDFAIGEYRRGDNRLTLHARRFADATGAYGAFTFYRQPGMHAEEIGKGAVVGGNNALFWTGTTLVDAVFEKPGGVDRAALKELAAALPQPAGSEGIPPSLPHYLPAQGLDANTVRYSIGPAAYARTGGVLPPALVDFSRDAEAVTAQYPARLGHGTLTLHRVPDTADCHRSCEGHRRAVEAGNHPRRQPRRACRSSQRATGRRHQRRYFT